MSRKNFFQRTLAAILVAIFTILGAAVAHAEVKTYEGVGEYLIADETVDFAKNQAELLAQRDALEKVCVYVKSETLTANGMLEDDEIITISAGILHITDTKFKIIGKNGDSYAKAFVTAEIDTVELEKLLDEAVKSKQNH